MQWLDGLAECSEDPAELTRRYLTPEHAQAAELIMRRMREAGMSARLDAVGNVVGSFPGRRPGARRLILGSHLDTVRNAGKYDGALGVMLPIACLRSLHERGRQHDYPIDVIAFGDEEGLRFQATLIGSQAVAGNLDPATLSAVDEDGVHLDEAMRQFGLDPDAVGEASYCPDEVAAYVEVHIEQGPVLEAENLPIGVVTSIVGAVRLRSANGMTGRRALFNPSSPPIDPSRAVASARGPRSPPSAPGSCRWTPSRARRGAARRCGRRRSER